MNRDPILERPLPSAPDAERAILGSLILDNALIDQAVFTLRDSRQTEGRSVSSMKEMARKARAHLAGLNSERDATIATPWKHLNNACRGGLNQTELWGLIAVQKHGKSSAAKQIAA